MTACTLRAAVRTPSPLPKPHPESLKHVQILHPGYDDDTNILLAFSPNDSGTKSDGSTFSGVQFHTVLTACAAIADNRFDGWIAVDRAGKAVELEEYEILESGNYWFHVPEQLHTTSSKMEVSIKRSIDSLR